MPKSKCKRDEMLDLCDVLERKTLFLMGYDESSPVDEFIDFMEGASEGDNIEQQWHELTSKLNTMRGMILAHVKD